MQCTTIHYYSYCCSHLHRIHTSTATDVINIHTICTTIHYYSYCCSRLRGIHALPSLVTDIINIHIVFITIHIFKNNLKADLYRNPCLTQSVALRGGATPGPGRSYAQPLKNWDLALGPACEILINYTVKAYNHSVMFVL